MRLAAYSTLVLKRLLAVASHTVIELVRLKTFHFLLLFALLLISSSIFFARLSFQEEFQVLKDVGLGVMNVLTSLLAIVATAQLLPRDLEDRTIYTILAKPISRLEYLAGKLSGVLFLLALGLAAMSTFFFLLLLVRERMVAADLLQRVVKFHPAQVEEALRVLRNAAFSPSLWPGIGLIYVKGCVLAALTLLISTFARSQIFTIVVMVVIYFIGHLQGMAREYWLAQSAGGRLAGPLFGLVALIFPDLQLFNLADDLVSGTAISIRLFVQTSMLGGLYTSIYLLFAWMMFSRKEL